MRIVILIVLFIWLIGQVMSEEPPLEKTSNGFQFIYEDRTNGNGNFVNNNKIVAHGSHSNVRVFKGLGDVSFQELGHGSGLIKREAFIKSNESHMDQEGWPDKIYAYASIEISKNSSIIYNPQNLSAGDGYYAVHPVKFESFLSDSTQFKNYASKTSMSQETRYAKAIQADLAGKVEDDFSGWYPYENFLKSTMNLNESVTNGTIHIGMLQGNVSSNSNIGNRAWHDSDADIDEDYTGTFDVVTKMDLTIPQIERIEEDDAWPLPCCSVGYSDMLVGYQKGSKGFGSNVESIFDCTCPYVPSVLGPLSIKIERPRQNATVSNMVLVTGQLSSNLAENEYLWLAVKPLNDPNENWWPQNNDKLISANRKFEANAFLGGKDGDLFEIGVLVVDESINGIFKKWLKTSIEENNWPSITEGRIGTDQKVSKEVIEAHKIAHVDVIFE